MKVIIIFSSNGLQAVLQYHKPLLHMIYKYYIVF